LQNEETSVECVNTGWSVTEHICTQTLIKMLCIWYLQGLICDSPPGLILQLLYNIPSVDGESQC